MNAASLHTPDGIDLTCRMHAVGLFVESGSEEVICRFKIAGSYILSWPPTFNLQKVDTILNYLDIS